jgi:hypothetical protein
MKVLHLPSNIASQASVTVRALREVGVDARGIVRTNHTVQDNSGLECFPPLSRRAHPVRSVVASIRWRRTVLRAIRWADVVHWNSCAPVLPRRGGLRHAARLRKARLVEFWGSDIRNPRIAAGDNPHYARVCERLGGDAAGASEERSREVQECFAWHGFQCLLPGVSLQAFLERRLFPSPYFTRQRLLLADYETRYPDPGNNRPLVVHSPTRKPAKGTDAVLQAVERLRSSHAFDFVLVHGVERSKALAILQKSDVFLDQFVAGDHGLTALEAMAFGKPTVCYIQPSLVSKYPPELPIVNADPDNLGDVLKELLEDGQRRNEIGRRSRAYVKRYHDAHQIARQLVGIYEALLAQAQSGRSRASR